MNLKNTKLYFVALLPSGTVLRKVQNLKEEVAEQYESKAALKSPPHITLHMPFRYREDREDKIVKVLDDYSLVQSSFQVKQDGFGAFPPRVIYVNVENSKALSHMRVQLIWTMRRELKLENADYKDRPFQPHMTIAFRDLKKRVFPEAWRYYEKQEFKEEWLCDSIVLLKHNGTVWEAYKEFELVSKEFNL